ncbi:hypothetical protein C2845_PM17G14320 [Panicum miliaceum]|uniref:Uncharacterized protein n=1 Tax=Panicum miliaceum TaxID=4540 RepID=A0A3L6Q5R3_PANMI|nr:hypothetical protein C2845_PM17G14320 [Panicum miliaceum]
MAAKTAVAVAAAACAALVLLSMGPAPVVADIQDDCRVICRPKCDDFTTGVCNTVIDIAPVLRNLDFFFTTCKVRVSAQCTNLCINICSLNTLTPAPPASPPPPPPPCKSY